MGCNSSSLANPSEFSHLTPSQPVTSSSLTKEPEPIESSLSAEAYTHAVPTMTRGERGDADNDLMGKYEEIGKPPKEPRVLLPHDFHFGHNKQDIYGSESHPKPTVPNGKRGYVVPFPRGKGRPSKEEWEAQEEEKARVKAAKAKEGRYGNLGKVAGLGEGERKDEESLAKGVWRKMKKGASNERGPGEGKCFSLVLVL
jgi:hypothetical protein